MICCRIDLFIFVWLGIVGGDEGNNVFFCFFHRSKQALELMKAAVEWKSWQELRTLSKAFHTYLEERSCPWLRCLNMGLLLRFLLGQFENQQEIRPADLERKKELETKPGCKDSNRSSSRWFAFCCILCNRYICPI